MGTIFRKTFTKPLPAGAKIIVRDGERPVRWKDAKGRTRTAIMVGDDAADEKNREGSTLPLRSDLAADLAGLGSKNSNNATTAIVERLKGGYVCR